MIGRALTYLPSDLEAHKDITKLINNRRDMLKTGKGITWAFAEALAFGSLMTHFSPGRSDINIIIISIIISSIFTVHNHHHFVHLSHHFIFVLYLQIIHGSVNSTMLQIIIINSMMITLATIEIQLRALMKMIMIMIMLIMLIMLIMMMMVINSLICIWLIIQLYMFDYLDKTVYVEPLIKGKSIASQHI